MKRGFTLIELLVVITILAVLAGVAAPYVQSYVEESRFAKAKADLEEIARALMVYETRETEYTASDVSLLTGRYLNKAPIDPWGRSYAVATSAGLVYSSGPDRDYTTSEDNIYFPYQPVLALVSVKWVDKNNSGAVDTQNINDELQLLFSRNLNVKADDIADELDTCFGICTSSAGVQNITECVNDNTARMVGSKTVVLTVKNNVTNPFVVGSDTLWVRADHGVLIDCANPPNYCIASQPVMILPQ